MLKKVLRVATTFALLLAGYAGYVRVFAVVARSLQPILPDARGGLVPIGPTQSQTARQALRLAERAFGAGHWSANPQLPVRYYNTERGYWMYAGDYARTNAGKRVKFAPFALIWTSKQGKALKVISGNEAFIDFDQPFGLTSPGAGPARMVFARIDGEVRIRDDKGTPAKPGDDLTITMPYVELDEPALQIRSDSAVRLLDRGTQVTGFGLRIDLRPGDAPGRRPGPAARSPGTPGFNGAKSIVLLKDIRIEVDDVGRSGILPGTARPSPSASKDPAARVKTPLQIACDGPMRIVLPEPGPAAPPGAPTPPPGPPRPTIADFFRNVVVRRGAGVPDQINGDHLKAILFPADPHPAPTSPGTSAPPKPAATAAATAADDPDEGPLTELALREARVDGHAVWLQSEAQGIKARGNELIYKKLAPERPDETYFRADTGKMLWLEKVEYDGQGPDRGAIKTVTTLWSTDATIFEDGPAGGRSTVIARGPGRMESRPARDQPVERSASWQDQLQMRSYGLGEQARRLVTLTGSPRVDDPNQFILDARDSIVLALKPKPKPKPPTAGPSATAPPAPATSESFQVEWMTALGNVHMVSTKADAPGDETAADPGPPEAPKKTMTANDRLDVVFEHPAPAPVPAAPAPAAVAPAAATPAETATAAAPAPAGPSPDAGPKPDAPQPQPQPAEPALDVQADLVWAKVVVAGPPGRSGRSKGEVREVRMRHAVRLHQDPAPGKARGMDVTADALDLLSSAPGQAQIQAQGTADQPAEASTAEFTIRGPILGLDQGADFAWVQGPGELNQTANQGTGDGGRGMGARERGSDQSPADAKTPAAVADTSSPSPVPRPPSPMKKGPLHITWKERMEFHGRPPDDNNQPGPARALFFADVHATQDDDSMACQMMEAILDRPVAFVRPPGVRKAARTAAEPAEARPQVVSVLCRRQVEIVGRKRDETTGAIREVQRVSGEDVTYDRPSGTFWVDGPGIVRSYSREAPKPTDASVSRTAASAPGPADSPPAALARTPSTATAAPRRPSAVDPRRKVQGPDRAQPRPLLLTRIDFRKGMEGKVGTPSAGGQAGPRQAEFRGGVQVLRAAVSDFDRDLDRDHPPEDFVALDSRLLQVESIPAPPGSKAPARTLLKATDNATARTIDSAIQGDWITYDSASGLFYVYGTEANPVSIASQNGPGLPPSSGTARVVRYNPRTGVSDVHGSGSFQFFQPKTGIRPNPAAPPGPEKEPSKPKRPELRLVPRGNTERKGFDGR